MLLTSIEEMLDGLKQAPCVLCAKCLAGLELSLASPRLRDCDVSLDTCTRTWRAEGSIVWSRYLSYVLAWGRSCLAIGVQSCTLAKALAAFARS